MKQTFTIHHLFWAVIFIVLGIGVAIWSPWRVDIAPETASLVARLHRATLDRAKADSSLVAYRKRVEAQSARLVVLTASQEAQTASMRQLRRDNAVLVERLAAHPESAGTIVPVLGQGIAALHVACEGALSACDSAKAVLTERAAMSDSAFQQERQRSTVNFNLATDATGAAVKWHVVADSYRRQRNISLILNGILAVIAAVK